MIFFRRKSFENHLVACEFCLESGFTVGGTNVLVLFVATKIQGDTTLIGSLESKIPAASKRNAQHTVQDFGVTNGNT
jgi:hypothetical protein